MDQIKIGKFIAALRKEKGYTQEQLAEKLSVSNKSISRWENGNTMPDLSLIPKLCEILNISINEFLSGERIDNSEYQKKLEENIIINMDLLKKKIRQISKRLMLIIISVFVLFLVALFLFIGYKELTYKKVYLDDNNIQITVCKEKSNLGFTISTKDETPFLFNSYYEEETKTYIIEKLFRYLDENNLQDISSTTTILFDKKEKIEKIVYADKVIYELGDELSNCN
ncbi:MAG: helix-turn-helix domain-containing protein [Firmicutes bacterium]|nr:helix-turn-helix domain-containing protein [Bacillota bacterium]